MQKKKYKRIKYLRHEQYKKRKIFYRKHGRKNRVLLSKVIRSKKKSKINSEKIHYTVSKKQPVLVTLPEILSLDNEYREEFLKNIKKIKTHLQSKKYKCSIDHSKIRRIDPEALLVLSAEIKRSVGSSHTRYMCYNEEYAPKDDQVERMLNSIGYWEHFGIDINDIDDKKRKYLKILHDTKADNTHVVDLKEFFSTKLNFLDEETEDMFDDAISEVIANSVEHAYIKKQKFKTIKKAWWLSGSYNIKTKELFFGCYDQGIGVKDALSHHDNRLIKKWVEKLKVMVKSDSNVIETLVREELPKYKDKDRGHGFKHFIKFIENYSQGSLNIYSKYGECKFIKDNESTITKKYDYNDSLDGTLIVWKIKLSGEIDD